MEKARVIEVRGGVAVIETDGGDACASCSARHACLSLGGTSRRLTVENTYKAEPGDIVEFTVDEKGVILSSLIVYGTPVMALIAGIIAGTNWHARMGLDSDAAGAIGGLAGMGLSLIVMRVITPFLKRRTIFTPRMTALAERKK